MPLITRFGRTVSLVRPVAKPPVKKPKKTRYEYGNQVPKSTLPKSLILKVQNYRCSQRRSKYPAPKVSIVTYCPALVLFTFRSVAVPLDYNLSDLATDILIYYFDNHFSGWEAQVPDFRYDTELLEKHSKLTSYQRDMISNNDLVPVDHSRNSKSHFRGVPRIHQHFRIPRSIFITATSVAIQLNRPVSDILIEAMMYYFDETMPGWELAGDIPEEDPNASGTP